MYPRPEVAAVVSRRLVSRPARARALARLARLAARGPAPRSRTAPIRERHRGAAAAHTVVVVAPVAAHVVISHRRHAATPRVAAAAATPTCVAAVTAHVIVAHPNLAFVSRRAAYASPRASNLTSVTIVIVTNRLATRTTHVSMLARLAGAGAGRLTSSRAPRRRATPCRRRRRGTVAVHTAIAVATAVVATARRLAARLLHTPTTAALHTAAPVVAAAATRALKARTPSLLRVAPCSPRLSPLCIQRPAALLTAYSSFGGGENAGTHIEARVAQGRSPPRCSAPLASQHAGGS